MLRLQMEWISVKDKLPDPFEVVWIYWRDKEVLLGCRTYDGHEAVICDPSEGWYSFQDDKCRWTHFWQKVNSMNLDKPNPPSNL